MGIGRKCRPCNGPMLGSSPTLWNATLSGWRWVAQAVGASTSIERGKVRSGGRVAEVAGYVGLSAKGVGQADVMACGILVVGIDRNVLWDVSR